MLMLPPFRLDEWMNVDKSMKSLHRVRYDDSIQTTSCVVCRNLNEGSDTEVLLLHTHTHVTWVWGGKDQCF